jgi:protein O-mannosyl-transferase
VTRAAALLAAIAVLAFLPSLAGPFHFDDYNVIVNYPTVHSWGSLFERAGAGVRPLLKASYAANWALDPGPLGFHAVNIALHALNTVLLFFIGQNLIRGQAPNYSVAFIAALLFALHPMQTEAVTYISGRSSSLMAAFYLGSMLAYLSRRTYLSAFLFVAAASTRETAVTLPAALLLVELCRGTPWREIARRQAVHWGLLAAAGLLVLLNARYFAHLAYGFNARGLLDNLITQVGGVSYLVLHLVTLHGLNIDPALPTLTEWTPQLAVQALLLLALLGLGITNLRKRPWLAFGILWFFLQLAPTNSLVPRLDVANDRQVYLACWGLFFALAFQLFETRVLRPAAVAVAIAFAAANVARQLDYADEITLWEASVSESPTNARARNNLGYAYYQAGRKADAWRELQLAHSMGEPKARANLVLLDWR